MRNTQQNYWVRYQNDLEDQFKLDCSEEDIKTDKDAKKCSKVLKRLRKSNNQYFNQLIKQDIVIELEVSNNMKKKSTNTNAVCGIILIIVAIAAIIGAAISATVFYFQNPDMTELRRFIEYPGPTIVAFVAILIGYVGKYLISKD